MFFDSINKIVYYYDGKRFVHIDIGVGDSLSIYAKDDTLKGSQIVHQKTKDNKYRSLSFKDGRVEIDTLLVCKCKLGLSTDTFLVVFNDTVRCIPKDSLWNIYTKDDSIRNTKNSNGKRTVYLQSKKLVFALGTNGAAQDNDTGKIGIGEQHPRYTLDIATSSYVKHRTHTNNTDHNNHYGDTIAVRISHNVTEGSGTNNPKTSYGLLLREHSEKANGRLAIGFEGGSYNTPFIKGRLWTQSGSSHNAPKFGIDVANAKRQLQTRMVIDSGGRVGLGTENPTERIHIVHSNGNAQRTTNIQSSSNNSNLIKVEAPSTTAGFSGLWLTEDNTNYGWRIHNNAKTDALQFQLSNGNKNDTILNIKRNGATILNTTTGGENNGDSVALLVKHKVQDKKMKYGLIISEDAFTANGKSAIGFYNANTNGTGAANLDGSTVLNSMNNYMKEVIWSELGRIGVEPTFGIDMPRGRDAVTNDEVRKQLVNRLRIGYTGLTTIASTRAPTYASTMLKVNGKIETNSICTTSDSILKKDVYSLEAYKMRSAINKLRPVIYHYRHGNSEKNYGFIAQEVERIFPEFVGESFHQVDSFAYKTLNYQALIAPTISNVQLLNAEIAELKKRLQQYEEKSSTLQRKLQEKETVIQKLAENVQNILYRLTTFDKNDKQIN